MNQRAAVHRPAQPFGVQQRAGFVVHLHAADETRAVVQRALQLVPAQSAVLTHADDAHAPALGPQPFEGLAHRRMLHRGDRADPRPAHLRRRAEDGQIVALRSAGGEVEVAAVAVNRLQQRFAALAHRPERVDGGAIDAGRIVKALRHAANHRLHRRAAGLRGGAVIEIRHSSACPRRPSRRRAGDSSCCESAPPSRRSAPLRPNA